ncbi:gamma-glutamyl peptidase 5-like, partial [Olea europaea var. sylvestris]|uniref:gamma-glutamyl peptidase 5-like n=1 Tax=Olea europaea var. sylvestris TaxID=158386 RepID=UPI000C1D631F
CRALGGKVGKAYSGWDIGIRKVRFTEEYINDSLNGIPPSLSIIECHKDEVCEVPEGAQVLACSDKTCVEMFKFGDYILGIQGHPEYNKDILDNIIDQLLSNISFEKGFAEEAKLNVMEAEDDRKYWKMICKSFLKVRWIT